MDDKDKMFDEENWDDEEFEEIDESNSEDLKPHKNRKTMKVEKGLFDNNVILNAEGDILKLVEFFKNDDDVGEPYLCVLCNKTNCKIYTKTNKTILTLYFQGRLTTKEVFLINLNEPYYIEDENGINEMNYSEDFHYKYIEDIECRDLIFYSVSKDTRIDDPFENIMRYWDMFY